MFRQVSFVSAVMLAAVSAQPFFSVPTGLGSNMISSMRQVSNSFGAAHTSMVQANTVGFKAGTNMTAGLASFIPVFGTFANSGATVLNSLADTISNTVQGRIKALQESVDSNLDMLENVFNMTGSAAQLGSNITGDFVNAGTSVLTSLPNITATVNNLTSSVPVLNTITGSAANESINNEANKITSLFNNFKR